MIRQLPKVRFQGKEYFVDNRLREFRTVVPPIEFTPFDSELGRNILFEFSPIQVGEKVPNMAVDTALN